MISNAMSKWDSEPLKLVISIPEKRVVGTAFKRIDKT